MTWWSLVRAYFSPARRLGRRIARDGLVPCGRCGDRLAEYHLLLRNLDVCRPCKEELD